MSSWPFEGLQMFGYDFIMADPPWEFLLRSEKGEEKSAQAQYECQELDWIKSLPVDQLAGSDCMLFLWATWPMLREAFEVLDAWHFKYVSGGHWHKVTKKGKQAFGTGYRVRCASEPFLLATIGNPVHSKSARNAIVGEGEAIEGIVRGHSRKPDEAYAWAEQYMPRARRADLFSRQTREGWDAWGNEKGKFDDAA